MNETKEKISSNQDAKGAILASIRQNLASSVPFDTIWSEHHPLADAAAVSRSVDGAASTREQILDDFRENLESVGGRCTIVADTISAAETVNSIIRETGARQIATSDSALIRAILQSQPTIEHIENASAGELFECDLGITSAQWGIAETGTLVLESDKETHRLTSLVPFIHLCVIKADQIRQTLGEILALMSEDLSPAVTYITGASRTSDIELTLAIGVHGPAELFVIVIND